MLSQILLLLLATQFAVSVVMVGYVAWRFPQEFRVILRFVGGPVRIVGWFVFCILVLAAAALFTVLGLGLAVGGATLVVLAMVLNRRARARRDALAELLAVCCERGMPLEPMLQAFADESPWRYARRIEQLIARLRAGMPLAEALPAVRGLCSQQVICAARTGTDTGRLGLALRDAVSLQLRRGPLWNQLVGRFWLLVWPVFGLVIASIFWSIFVFPKVVQIWDDFGFEQPPVGMWLHETIRESLVKMTMLGVSGAAILLLGWMLLAYIGWVPMLVPFSSYLFSRLEAAPVLRGLALYSEAGRPLGEGLWLLAECYPSRSTRRRLRQAAEQVDRGEDWTQALAGSGMVGAADAALLDASTRMGNVGWALRMTADAGERRFTYRALAVLQSVFPLAILVIGLAVLVMVLATYVPLAEIIKALSV